MSASDVCCARPAAVARATTLFRFKEKRKTTFETLKQLARKLECSETSAALRNWSRPWTVYHAASADCCHWLGRLQRANATGARVFAWFDGPMRAIFFTSSIFCTPSESM